MARNLSSEKHAWPRSIMTERILARRGKFGEPHVSPCKTRCLSSTVPYPYIHFYNSKLPSTSFVVPDSSPRSTMSFPDTTTSISRNFFINVTNALFRNFSSVSLSCLSRSNNSPAVCANRSASSFSDSFGSSDSSGSEIVVECKAFSASAKARSNASSSSACIVDGCGGWRVCAGNSTPAVSAIEASRC